MLTRKKKKMLTYLNPLPGMRAARVMIGRRTGTQTMKQCKWERKIIPGESSSNIATALCCVPCALTVARFWKHSREMKPTASTVVQVRERVCAREAEPSTPPCVASFLEWGPIGNIFM